MSRPAAPLAVAVPLDGQVPGHDHGPGHAHPHGHDDGEAQAHGPAHGHGHSTSVDADHTALPFSLLMAGAGQRLAGVAGLLGLLWLAVAWALGEPG